MFVLLTGFPLAAHTESIMVGDIDFGPDVRFGTAAPRGIGEQYLKESLNAYQAGIRRHKEMSVVSAMLDGETVNFMARSFAAYIAPPMKSADDLIALACGSRKTVQSALMQPVVAN